MRADKAINIEDLRRLAKRRLPKIIFDFIEGGAEDELGLRHNQEGFTRHRFRPRYLVDSTKRDQSVSLFGRSYASPFGIAPTGILGLYRPGADLMLAEAAREANIPFIQSGTSNATIEEVAKVAPDHALYQLYQPREPKIADDFVRRARDASVGTFVLTVDSQGPFNAERNLRNGFTQPLRMKPAIVLESLLHPAWILGYLRHGVPVLVDWKPYAPPDSGPHEIAKFITQQGRAAQTWRDVERYRKDWKGNLVLKGILHREDARRAAEAGVDGILVSNHGGRQFERAPAPIEVLPGIVEEVGSRITVMMDSGVSQGVDMLIAYALGAKFVFVGRATAWGVIAGGLEGAKRSIAILKGQIDVAMGQVGCTSPGDLPNITLIRPGR